MERRYIIKPNNRLSFGYYSEERECFSAQVDFLALGTDNAVMVTDVDGSKLLATNPDITCELPFTCWCLEDLIPLLEIHDFTPLGRRNDMSESKDLRRAHDALLERIKQQLPELETLLKEMSEVEESGVYWYYHSDPRAYGIQHFTERACALFRKIAAHNNGDLALLFEIVVKEGTNRTLDLAPQSRVWIQDAAPVIAAFFHARYFINQHVRYGKELEQSPDTLPPGWAAILCLYELR